MNYTRNYYFDLEKSLRKDNGMTDAEARQYIRDNYGPEFDNILQDERDAWREEVNN